MSAPRAGGNSGGRGHSGGRGGGGSGGHGSGGMSASSAASAAQQNNALICRGHSRPVPLVAFSGRSRDGCFLASACLDGKAMLRHGATGDWIGTFNGHKGAVWSVAIDPKAHTVATASADYTVRVWSAITGECLQTVEHKRIMRAVALDTSGCRLLAGGQEKTIHLSDVTRTETPTVVFRGHTELVRSLSWLNEHTFVSGGADPGMRVWDVRTGKQEKMCTTSAGVVSIEVQPNGSYITTASGEEVVIWSSQSLAPARSHPMGTEVTTATLHPSLTCFAYATPGDFGVRTCDFSLARELDVVRGHHGPIHCARYSPDGALLATASEDGTIRLLQHDPSRPYGLWRDRSAPGAAAATALPYQRKPAANQFSGPPPSEPPPPYSVAVPPTVSPANIWQPVAGTSRAAASADANVPAAVGPPPGLR